MTDRQTEGQTDEHLTLALKTLAEAHCLKNGLEAYEQGLDAQKHGTESPHQNDDYITARYSSCHILFFIIHTIFLKFSMN